MHRRRRADTASVVLALHVCSRRLCTAIVWVWTLSSPFYAEITLFLEARVVFLETQGKLFAKLITLFFVFG
jgi:hypothetical protein